MDNGTALTTWKTGGGARPATRPDGIPTRIDMHWMTPAELAITDAVLAVEAAGASPALTSAVMLLLQARERVANHTEGKTA